MVTFTQKLSFLKGVFGKYELDRKQENAIFTCPACGTGTSKKKFYINLTTWQCHCWSCNIKGKTILPILRKHGTRDDVSLFMNHLGIKQRNLEENTQIENERVRLPDEFLLLADNMTSMDPDIKSCIKYLYSRGLTEKDLWRYRLGTSRSGRFRRRIIFPSFDIDGILNFFVTRAIDRDVRRKYINSNVNKKLIVFNEIDIDWSSQISLVEGPFDMVKAGENSTCILGSSLSPDYFLFSKIISNRSSVLLCLDSDMKDKEQKIAKLLSSYGCDVKILSVEGFSDVGEMTREEFSKRKKSAKPWSHNEMIKMRIGSLRSGSLF
jgi:hypothetical protein